MGGYGSGRWAWHDSKTTVEECLVLDVGQLIREGVFKHAYSGPIHWTDRSTGETIASAWIGLEPTEGNGISLLLGYTVRVGGDQTEVDEQIPLQLTCPHFGGVRYWFTCPLTRGYSTCGRRVGKLYLPPGQRYYGCRCCYDLTYQSCRERHRSNSLFRRMGRGFGISLIWSKGL